MSNTKCLKINHVIELTHTRQKETKGKDKNTVIKEMEENGKCEIQTIKETKGSLQSVSQYFDTFGCFNKFFFHRK